MPDLHKLPFRTWRDDVSAEFIRFRSRMTRENIVSNLKTLAWVVPLTLLIWIWAEREQVLRTENVPVPFELSSSDPNRAVRNKSNDNNLVLVLSGPQARQQELVNKLSGGQMPRGLKLDVPTTYAMNQDHVLSTLEMVNSNPIFREYGVTVVTVQPARIEVSIDELVEREAHVVVPPSVNNVKATFDPPTMKVRGPLNLLNRAAQVHQGQLVVYAVADAWPRTPGTHTVPDVVVVAPDDLKDDRVHIHEAKATVRATLEVRLADQTLHYDSLPVSEDWAYGQPGKYAVMMDRPAVPNVTVMGPPDIIDAMQRPDFRPRPKARLVITPEDLLAIGERRSKAVEYDLPKGVDVSPDDQKKTVEYRVVDRSTTPTP
jgi:hypothetical protein